MVSIHTFLGIGNSVGRRLMLNLVWEKLARSILTASPFWPEFRKLIFWHVFDFFPTLTIYMYISWNECGISYVGFCERAAISLTFDTFLYSDWSSAKLLENMFSAFSYFFFHFFIVQIVLVDSSSWIWCWSGYLAQSWLLLIVTRVSEMLLLTFVY